MSSSKDNKSYLLSKRLDQARRHQVSYRPNEDIARQLKHVTIGSIIGVTAIGKSHLINAVVSQEDSHFSEASIISSRAFRPNDSKTFRANRSIERLLEQMDHGELVNYFVHPSGHVYATDLESYTTEYVLLPTVTSAIEQLKTMNCFKRIIPIGLVVEGSVWHERVKERIGDSKFQARMHEALDCIAWLQANSSHIPILVNNTGQEITSSQAIIDILRNPSQTHSQGSITAINALLSQLNASVNALLQEPHSRHQGV